MRRKVSGLSRVRRAGHTIAQHMPPTLRTGKHVTSKLVMRQRDEPLQRRGARASFTGDMRSFTGCSGHIGHFRASGAEHVRIAPAHSQPALAVYAHHRSRTQSRPPDTEAVSVRYSRKAAQHRSVQEPGREREWNKEHWFATREERDRALKEMSGRYVYFRLRRSAEFGIRKDR